MHSCYRILRCLLLSLLLGVGVQAQTSVPVDASPLPQLPGDTLGLGPVDIELISAPGVAIVEDHQGYMWFGGSTGLARYDGHNVTLYQHEPDDSTSLPISWVESLHVDREGTLWVGTYGGGLNRYDPDTDSFLPYRHDPEDPASLSQDTVTVILEDRQGTLWVGTHGGLNRFDAATGTFTRYRHDPDDPTSLIHNKVMSIYEDRRGRFFVGTLGDGLHTMDREAGTFTRHRTDSDDPSKLSRPFREGVEEVEGCTAWDCGGVSFIYEDDRGRYWIGGVNIGVDRYDPDTGARSRYDLASAAIWSVFESSDGTLWVGTWGGVHKLITSENIFRHVAQDPTDPGSLEGNHITDLLEDEEGHLWVSFSERLSLQPGGVDRLDASTGTFTHFRYDPERQAVWRQARSGTSTKTGAACCGSAGHRGSAVMIGLRGALLIFSPTRMIQPA